MQAHPAREWGEIQENNPKKGAKMKFSPHAINRSLLKPLWDLPVPELYAEFISFWMKKTLLWA